MSETTLEHVAILDSKRSHLCFADGTFLELPEGTKVKDDVEGEKIVWELDCHRTGRCCAIARGRGRSTCESVVRYLAAEE